MQAKEAQRLKIRERGFFERLESMTYIDIVRARGSFGLTSLVVCILIRLWRNSLVPNRFNYAYLHLIIPLFIVLNSFDSSNKMVLKQQQTCNIKIPTMVMYNQNYQETFSTRSCIRFQFRISHQLFVPCLEYQILVPSSQFPCCLHTKVSQIQRCNFLVQIALFLIWSHLSESPQCHPFQLTF